MYREYRDHRGRLHRHDGPAVEADDRQEWWIEGRRHYERGPAVQSKKGTRWYYWRGVLVPPEVVTDPKSKKPEDILKIENIEVRRSWMESYGMEDFMLDMRPEVLSHNTEKDLMLIKIAVESGEPIVMVRVRNSTPEGKWSGGQPCLACDKVGYSLHPDSTDKDEIRVQCVKCGGAGHIDMTFTPELRDGKPWWKHYFIRVPPDMKDAEEAVAWTFGMKKGEYVPALET